MEILFNKKFFDLADFWYVSSTGVAGSEMGSDAPGVPPGGSRDMAKDQTILTKTPVYVGLTTNVFFVIQNHTQFKS